MTNFIPVFPLGIVVFPGEPLNLHIFEPRYIQLIQECIAEKKPFGIPTVISSRPGELGTLVEVEEVAKTYENGEMDVRTRGQKVFRILEMIREIPDKMYSGAIVNYPDNLVQEPNSSLSRKILDEVKRLYTLMNVEGKYPKENTGAISYAIGHYVGLSVEQEYELLGLFDELQRLEYIRRHLNKMLPVIKELEEMKARVQMNGHFRNLSLGDLDIK
ncbi:LON peptidase substrate-binding domain-containing protein [Chitinophagaceae bacterium MMS25-I14]